MCVYRYMCVCMCIHFISGISCNQNYQVVNFLRHVLFQTGHTSTRFTLSEYYLLVTFSIGLYQITHGIKS